LVASLELPYRPPRVEDSGQMLALPDLDVLDALGCDVVTIADGVTNAIDQSDLWHPYDFNGRLPASVRWPGSFQVQPDGSILQWGRSRMVPGSTVFDEEHGGQPLDLSADLPKVDLLSLRKEMGASIIRDEQIVYLSALCQNVRDASSRAVFFNDANIQAPMGIAAYGGLAIFPMLCLTEPDFVADLHSIVVDRTLKNIRALLPEIKNNVDIIMIAADDWGTQNNLIASSRIYRTLFLPFYKQITDECHLIAPNVKLFFHSCGAIYDLIDLVIESGFDILNPVQWSAGARSFQEWKEKSRGRIALWGGGVNSQKTLPLGSVQDVVDEVRQTSNYMAQDGGFVFCNIHNILAEIESVKVIAMYQSA
jgi:uroporphyrinogen decarboxylase